MAETLESDKHVVSGGPGSAEPGMLDSGLPVEDKDQEVVMNALEVGGEGGVRGEIDTSAPFDYVREAVSRFGGFGFWKPSNHQIDNDLSNRDKLFMSESHQRAWEEIDAARVEEQAAQLEKELIIKEKDTLKVLKELEVTKMIVEDLKLKLQKAESAVHTIADVTPESKNTNVIKEENKENDPPPEEANEKLAEVLNSYPSSAPGLILMELKQAKLNLIKTTGDLAEIRASVKTYSRKIEKEKMSLEKTHERLSSNSSKISSLEEELNRTRMKLQLVKDGEGCSGDGKDIVTELQRLNCEAEMFKKLGATAKAEVEQIKAKIKTTEIRLIAAGKMKEAARAAEAVALAEIKALEKSNDSSSALCEQNSDGVTLTYEEYSSLTCKAIEATEKSKKREMDAVLQVDEANMSKMEILKRVDEAMEEVKTFKKALEDALNMVDEANKAKLAVEEARRRWRSEHGQKRKSVQNSTKFKISGPTESRRDSQMLDVNGINLASEAPGPMLKSTLSIGQILSRKLLVAEEFEPGKNSIRRKVSLGQMLGKQNGELSTSWKLDKENGGESTNPTSNSSRKLPTKRKKFGFARFSVLLAKQSGKKKKKPTTKML